jgi:hypothetical protein
MLCCSWNDVHKCIMTTNNMFRYKRHSQGCSSPVGAAACSQPHVGS